MVIKCWVSVADDKANIKPTFAQCQGFAGLTLHKSFFVKFNVEENAFVVAFFR